MNSKKLPTALILGLGLILGLWWLLGLEQVSLVRAVEPTTSAFTNGSQIAITPYASPTIAVSPDVLTSTQFVNLVITKPLTISNGGEVTMTFTIKGITNAIGEAALDFDGIDDELNMGTSDVLMLSDTDLTVEAWISATTTAVGWILGKHDPGWGNGYGLMINHQDCMPNKACFDTAGDHMAAISTTDANDGQWHHIAGVYYVSGTKRIFIDGILEDSNPAPVPIPSNTVPFRVGYVYESHGGEQFQGRIDEVRVWNIARTEAEIQSTMNTPLIGNEPGLVGYWKFDEGSGQTAYDSTANGNDGQLGSTPGVDADDPSWFQEPHQGGDFPPWLTTDPVTGTVAKNSSAQVQLSFDSTGLQPGSYTTQVVIQSNDPVTPSVPIPVTMTVLPTADMGRVAGTVSDARTGQPLTATVELVGVYSMTASPAYTIWAQAGSYSLTAYAPGYLTTARPVDITAGGLTTENLALEPPPNIYFPIIFRNYCPDFFDDFSNPSSGWSVADYSNVLFEYKDGEYRILSKKSGYIFFPKAPTCQRSNFFLEADMRWASTPGTAYGLIFGKDGYEDGIYYNFVDYYLFDMNSGLREFRLLRCGSSGCNSIVSPTFNSAIRGGTSSNHLKATRDGGQITLEANGTILGTWTDGAITGWMNVGIVSLPGDNSNADARYDNFSAISLPDSSAAIVGSRVTATDQAAPPISGGHQAVAPIAIEWGPRMK